MSDKDLGRALLDGESSIDLQALTRQVLKRDRRRITFLGIACFIAWMLVVMLPWATIMPMLAKVVEHQTDVSNGRIDAATQSQQSYQLMQIVKIGTMATFFGSIASMFVAALCTVLLIVASRRATLRQVNARLGEISAQLKALASAPK